MLKRKYRAYFYGGGAHAGQSPVVQTLGPGNTKAQLLTAIANMNIDIIELQSGNYDGTGTGFESIAIDVDRTARPLTIRPAFNATPTFIGPAHTDGTIFNLGTTTTAKFITFNGTNGGSSALRFSNFKIASSGVFEPRATQNCSFIGNIVYGSPSGLQRDTAFAPNPFNSWLFYIDSVNVGVRQNDQLLIGDGMQALAPLVARDISCMQQDDASAHSDGTIIIRNIPTIQSYHYAYFCDIATASITLDTWTGDNNGHTATPASIRFSGAVNIAGTYKNIHFTTSDPFFDNHSGGGVITNGGGNSGI